MTLTQQADRIRTDFVAGKIPAEELLLHLEPVLNQAASDAHRQQDARVLVNRIERALYTEAKESLSHELLQLVGECVAFIRHDTV